MGGGRGRERVKVAKGGDGMGRRDEARNRGGRRSNSEGETAVSKPRGRGGSIEEGKVEVARRAAREGETLDRGPPVRGERVNHVREEVPVRRSSRSKRASEGGGNQAEGLERAEGAVGSRGDGDGGGVARRERTREGRKEVDDVSDTPEGQAGEERVHLLRVRGTSSRGGGRKAALPTHVAARVRTVRGGTSAVSA